MKQRLLRHLFPAAVCAAGVGLVIGCAVDTPALGDAEPIGSSASELLTCATAPHLYTDPQHESPVHGDPGDLLFIAGNCFDSGARVVYHVIDATSPTPVTPTTLPSSSTGVQGTIVPLKVRPYGTTIKLDPNMVAGKTYALWVANPDGLGGYAFSAMIRINDPRPMWLSPSFVYEEHMRPGLERLDATNNPFRALKVVGRNLQPVPGFTTMVRLTRAGAAPLTPISVVPELNPQTEIEAYAVVVKLPNTVPGSYTVEVSRDSGATWTALVGSTLEVRQDRSAPVQFNVADSAYQDPVTGVSCAPDDGADDAGCILRALNAATIYVHDHPTKTASVVLSAGTWLIDSKCWSQNTVVPFGGVLRCQQLEGLVVTPGVNIRGLGAPAKSVGAKTIIQTGKGFDEPLIDAWQAGTGKDVFQMRNGPSLRQNVFALLGDNVVENIVFQDAWPTCYYQGDLDEYCVHGDVPRANSAAIGVWGHDVTVTRSLFDGVHWALITRASSGADAWMGVRPDLQLYGYRDLVFTDNVVAVNADTAFNVHGALMDSVIAGNVFWPGRYSPDVSTCDYSVSGPIALGFAGGRRVDVSSNVVDGSVQAYSGDDRLGFRAGMFFPHLFSQENLLVAGNSLSCIGTIPCQDGEAISTDSNKNLYGADSVQSVLVQSTSPDKIVLADGLKLDSELVVGRWVQVVSGPGVGQARKIVEVSTSKEFRVDPPFDVVPTADSRVLVSQQTWQTYFVGNTVDNRACALSDPVNHPDRALDYDSKNIHDSSTGLIQFYNTSSDSVIDFNRSYDVAGIKLQTAYLYSALNPVGHAQTGHYFDEVSHNLVNGFYGVLGKDPVGDPASNTYGGGIYSEVQVGTQDSGGAYVYMSDILNLGLMVSKNTVIGTAVIDAPTSASRVYISAISLSVGMNPDLDSYATPGHVNALVFGNTIESVPMPPGDRIASAFLNGDGSQNYPQDTFICFNTVTSPPASSYTDLRDVPPLSTTSSLCTCGAPCP